MTWPLIYERSLGDGRYLEVEMLVHGTARLHLGLDRARGFYEDSW